MEAGDERVGRFDPLGEFELELRRLTGTLQPVDARDESLTARLHFVLEQAAS